MGFSAKEAFRGKVLTLDQVKHRGILLANMRFLCEEEEETKPIVDLLHKHQISLGPFFGSVGYSWGFPLTVR